MKFSRAINENGYLYVPYAEVHEQETKLNEELEVYKKALELMAEELASNKHCTCHPYCYIEEDEEDCQLIEECHSSKWLFDYYLQEARKNEAKED